MGKIYWINLEKDEDADLFSQGEKDDIEKLRKGVVYVAYGHDIMDEGDTVVVTDKEDNSKTTDAIFSRVKKSWLAEIKSDYTEYKTFREENNTPFDQFKYAVLDGEYAKSLQLFHDDRGGEEYVRFLLEFIERDNITIEEFEKETPLDKLEKVEHNYSARWNELNGDTLEADGEAKEECESDDPITRFFSTDYTNHYMGGRDSL
jgi:hypothetical protein